VSAVLVLSGGGDYADPWHPFAATSAIVAGLLREDGHEVEVVDTLDALAERLPDADALVVNAGGGPVAHPLDGRLSGILAGYRGPLLALHVAATLLPEDPSWEETIGGRWVRGTTMHPPGGPLRARGAAGSALVAGLPLDTVDEAYCFLRVADDADVILTHELDGIVHPICWTLDRGGRRTAYDALGHDPEAYAAPLPRELVRRLVRWLLA